MGLLIELKVQLYRYNLPITFNFPQQPSKRPTQLKNLLLRDIEQLLNSNVINDYVPHLSFPHTPKGCLMLGDGYPFSGVICELDTHNEPFRLFIVPQ